MEWSNLLLTATKCLIPSAELRHKLLPLFATLQLPKKIHHSLKTTVEFKDNSQKLKLDSPILLAAGANKNGNAILSFKNMGFGGVCIGSITQQAEIGNTHRPRMSLLPKDKAIHNAIGLTNNGSKKTLTRIQKILHKKHHFVIGINITPTPKSPQNQNTINELNTLFCNSYPLCDYLEINLSCPNTEQAKIDENLKFSKQILKSISNSRQTFKYKKAVLIKLSPDMSNTNRTVILNLISKYQFSGVVISNTLPLTNTIPLNTKFKDIPFLTADGKKGGLSGLPLYKHNLNTIKAIKQSHPHLTIFAVGGIDTGQKAWQMLQAGAELIQCYSVLAYRWNAISKINCELIKNLKLHHHY